MGSLVVVKSAVILGISSEVIMTVRNVIEVLIPVTFPDN